MLQMKRCGKGGVKGLRLLPFCLFILLLSAACSSIDCPVQNLVYTNYELHKADGTVDTLNTDTVWILSRRADGTDTLLLNSLYGSDATKFSLQISYTNPEDIFVLLLRDTAQHEYLDTFRIKKENYPHFESVDCQATYFHEITATSTTHHVIDSITINYPKVNYDVTHTHFYIYFKDRR